MAHLGFGAPTDPLRWMGSIDAEGGDRPVARGAVDRRRAMLGAIGAVAGAAAGCSATGDRAGSAAVHGPSARPLTPSVRPPPAAVLPNGARTVFPGSRLVGWCGRPGGTALGRMTGELTAAGRGMESQAARYAVPGYPVLPVVELIATVAHPEPGADGMYRSRSSDALIATYLAQARRDKGLLLLNIQPGRASFPDEVMAYARWLAEPDVGVALDPEWAMGPGEIPGQRFGSTTGAELNTVSAYLSGLVAKHRLPQKVMAYHQVAASVVSGEDALLPQHGVAPVKSVDGIGAPGVKRETWNRLVRDKPTHVVPGFKLFYEEDVQRGGTLMTPEQVLALEPSPGYVMYE